MSKLNPSSFISVASTHFHSQDPRILLTPHTSPQAQAPLLRSMGPATVHQLSSSAFSPVCPQHRGPIYSKSSILISTSAPVSWIHSDPSSLSLIDLHQCNHIIRSVEDGNGSFSLSARGLCLELMALPPCQHWAN